MHDRSRRCGFSLSLKCNGHVGTRKISPYLPLSATELTPHSALRCLTCASPFSDCPVFNAPVVFDATTRTYVITVDHCWCLACEQNVHTLCESGSPHTAESAQRETHSARALERFVFEIFPAHAHYLSYATRVPVLYLRQLFLNDNNLYNAHDCWGVQRGTSAALGAADGVGVPSWLRHIYDTVDEDLTRDVLAAVFAPFAETLCFVRARPQRVLQLLGCAAQLRTLYAIDVPDALLRDLRSHRIYAALLLRVVVTYRLLHACNGYAWDFDLYDSSVPYKENEDLQNVCLKLQLFADTHLAAFACVHAFGDARFDDVFFSSALSSTHETQSSHANLADTGVTPLAARLTMLERFYPHPLRAPYAGEVSALDGTPLYAGNMWNVRVPQTSAMSGSSGGGSSSHNNQNMNVNASATTAAKRDGNIATDVFGAGATGGGKKSMASKRKSSLKRATGGDGAGDDAGAGGGGAGGGTGAATAAKSNLSAPKRYEDEFLESMVHLFLSKTLNYRSLRRNYANIATRNFHNFPALFAIQKASLELSALGNYPGGRYRPLWRARIAVHQAHHFAPLDFEPAWCASCGTERLKSTTRMVVTRNECKRCAPVKRELWCAAKCMRSDFVSADDAQRVLAADGACGADALYAAQTSVMNSAVQQQLAHEHDRVTRLEVDAAFEKARANGETAGECDLCLLAQERRLSSNRRPLSAEEMLQLHFAEMHLCPHCREREHDDAQRVHERLVERGKKTKVGSKALCSRHLCDACEVIGRNELYSFYVAKEMYAYRVDADMCAAQALGEYSNWRAYRDMLFAGMDEARVLFDRAYRVDELFAREPVAPAALNTELGAALREHMHHFHRCIKKTSTKFKKEPFVTVLRKALKTCFDNVCVQRTMTRPQRPEDFLDDPNLVLDIARIRRAELRAKKNVRSEAHRESLMFDLRESTRNAFETLRRWHDEYKFTSADVHAVAQMAAAQTMRVQTDSAANSLHAPQPSNTALINFRALRYVGIDEDSLNLVQDMAFNYEVLALPDNPIAQQVRALERTNRADFCALYIFCNVYKHVTAFRVYPLSIDAARAQMAALRTRAGILPHEEAPADLDVRHVCRDCNQWFAPLAAPMRYCHLKTVIRNENGDPLRGRPRRVRAATSAAGHDYSGECTIAQLSGAAEEPWRVFKTATQHVDPYAIENVPDVYKMAGDTVRTAAVLVDESGGGGGGHGNTMHKKVSTVQRAGFYAACHGEEMLLDLRMGELVCPLNNTSTNFKRMLKYSQLDHDLVYENDPSKASSIRAMRQRFSQCGSRPLMKIAMLGVAVRLSCEGTQSGGVYALCGICAQLFCMTEGKSVNGGVPVCGQHARVGGLATNPYLGLYAYAPPQLHCARLGAAAALRFAQVAPDDARPYTSLSMTRAEIASHLYLLDTYEYGAPRRVALGELSGNKAAARGWVRATYTIAQPKGVVEKSAANLLRCVFPTFDIEHTVTVISNAPSSVPQLTSAEIKRQISRDWMRFDDAKARVKGEECTLQDEFQNMLDMLLEQDVDDAEHVASAMANDVAAVNEAHMTRRRARAEKLIGGVPPELIALREHCMDVLHGEYGIGMGEVIVSCAFCGKSATITSRFVRVDVLDPDGLCRNRFTAAPVLGTYKARYAGANGVTTAPRVELFFCETHFGPLQPLLANFLQPTAAMIFVYLTNISREALQLTDKIDKRAYNIATQYEDYFGTEEEAREEREAMVARNPALFRKRKRMKRSRLSTLPERRAKKRSGKKRGRRPGQKNFENDLSKLLDEEIDKLDAAGDDE